MRAYARRILKMRNVVTPVINRYALGRITPTFGGATTNSEISRITRIKEYEHYYAKLMSEKKTIEALKIKGYISDAKKALN